MLEPFREQVRICYDRVRCGFCIAECPIFEYYRDEPATSRGRIAMTHAILNGTIEPTPGLADRVYACTTCGYCAERCKTETETVKIFEALRAELVRAGVGPRPDQAKWAESEAIEHNPYFEKHEKRLDWLPSEFKQPMPDAPSLMYFVGCTSSYREQQIARATINILTKTELNFVVHPDEWCCGSPLLRIGFRDLVRKQAEHNLGLIKELGVKQVIATCAGCYRTFKKDYKEMGLDNSFEVLHTTELLRDLIQSGNLEFDGRHEIKVTYHDPCHLGRHGGVYEAPRKILQAIPGITLIEPERTRNFSYCCGSGGGLKSGFRDVAAHIAEKRIQELEQTGAEAVVSSCPFCYTELNAAIHRRNSALKMYDIIELVDEAVK